MLSKALAMQLLKSRGMAKAGTPGKARAAASSPVGGHNVLEPARAGVGVLTGPHTAHVEADVATLEKAGGLLRLRDATGLAEALAALGWNPGKLKEMGRAAGLAAQAAGGGDALAQALSGYLA